ncbi:hypothetical protein CEP53_007387 [Fusarium sp. AF-6]|nr:hypothetical protein CEP53_007387 [Fusarium sp. AF-6]
MSEYQISCRLAGRQALRLRNVLREIARDKPHDEQAQRRARAAIDFCHKTEDFADVEDTDELPVLSRSDLGAQHGDRAPVLPIEIYQLIVNYVTEWDYVTRQMTLLALCRSSRTLQSVAEPFLYNHPRDLDSIKRQWGFRFTLAIEPHLPTLVKSLRLLWDAEGENGNLIVDIARACPNVDDMLIERGMDFEDSNHVSTHDVMNMATLLDTCPRLKTFWYATNVSWTSEQQQQEDESSQKAFDESLKDGRFAKAAQKLTSLTFHGQFLWLIRALSPHLSSNLECLTLGQDFFIEQTPNLLSDLSRQCPSLRELELRCRLITADELSEACKRWGSTLQKLRVWSIEEVSDWVVRVMPSMTALREIDFGLGCTISVLDLDAIGQASPPQRLVSVSAGDLEDPTDSDDHVAAQNHLNDVIARLVNSHSSTLQELDLSTTLGQVAVRSCKKAKKLVKLFVNLDEDVEPSDVDDLLDACPDLVYVASFFGINTPRRKEWDKRRLRFEAEAEEEARRDRSLVGLGS